MATTIRYVPRGYIDTERALIRIATIRKPDRWHSDGMHPKEREIYAGLGQLYNAQYLGDHLRVQIPAHERKENPEILERLLDYNDAIYDLREALHAGDFVAEFVDEHGIFDFIKSEGWGGEAGLEILCCGIAWLDYGPLTASRLVLFRSETIEKFGLSLVAADVSSTAQSTLKQDKGGRPPEYDWSAIKDYVSAMVREHGRPGKNNKRLPSQQQLVEAVMDEWSGKFDQQLAESSVRRYVRRWLTEL